MKSVWGGNRKTRTLTGQISRIVLILILVGVIETAVAYMMLDWYHAQVAELEYIISDIYLSQTDQNFNLINTSVRSMLYDRSEVRDVVEARWDSLDYAGEMERLANTLEMNNSVIHLKNTFGEMVTYYGSRYNFFFLDSANELEVEYGGGEYAKRRAFMAMIRQLAEKDELRYTSNGKWFLLGDYICTIYRGPHGIGGTYMWVEDFATNMLQMSPTECSSIEIYEPESQRFLFYERQANGSLLEAESVTAEGRPEDYYHLNSAGFVCRFVMDTSGYEKTVLLPVLFFGLLGLYLMVMAVIWLYTRREVLGQVNSFYSNLIAYKGTERFSETMEVAEFAEASKVLNQRSEEISKLKISVYEEQISRQKVELDYAQLQIRPHFYINCLNIIHSMAQEKLTSQIQEFVVHISRYFRYIFKKGMGLVTVAKELEFTETYLKILECMNDTQYRYEVSCEEALSGVLIPPLIIQTFVENAVKHNFDRMDDCAVCVRVERLHGKRSTGFKEKPGSTLEDDGNLSEGLGRGDVREWMKITVLDNGNGFDDETLARFCAEDFGEEGTGYHIGIRNAVARLRMIYGTGAQVIFSNREAQGARVEIQVPLNEERSEIRIAGEMAESCNE